FVDPWFQGQDQVLGISALRRGRPLHASTTCQHPELRAEPGRRLALVLDRYLYVQRDLDLRHLQLQSSVAGARPRLIELIAQITQEIRQTQTRNTIRNRQCMSSQRAPATILGG